MTVGAKRALSYPYIFCMQGGRYSIYGANRDGDGAYVGWLVDWI